MTPRDTPDMAHIHANSLIELARKEAGIIASGIGEISKPCLYVRACELSFSGSTASEVEASITRSVDAVLTIYGLDGASVQVVIAANRIELERMFTDRGDGRLVIELIEGLGIRVERSAFAIGLARMHGEALKAMGKE